MITNCLIKARPTDFPDKFYMHIERGIENLDGYAIIPREEYDALVKATEIKETPP